MIFQSDDLDSEPMPLVLPIVGYLHTLHVEGGSCKSFSDDGSQPFHIGKGEYATAEPLVKLSDAIASIQGRGGRE